MTRAPRIAVAAALVAMWLLPATVAAHSGGVSGADCVGCHGGGEYAASVTASPANFGPGDNVTMTLTVNASGSVLGAFIGHSTGSLGSVSGQGMATVPLGLSHTSPKSMSGGSASFAFTFAAPSQPGAVRLDVSTLVGNGKSSGDLGQRKFFDFVYGCAAATYYRDLDGDGFGLEDLPLVHCADAAPSGYAAQFGDCNDNLETVYPGAVEICNQIDDDCDDAIDDDAIPAELYPDADGDGYYGTEEFLSGEMITGCVPTDGWAAQGGDCRPDDPLVNPGQEEVCNLYDDDCDNKIDEKVRPRCGTGWCAAESSNCEPIGCFPGDPRDERCNLFDDDCDGFVDNDAPCDAGLSCIAGECRPTPEGEEAPAAEDATNGGGCAVGGRADDWLASIYLLALLGLGRRRRSRLASS
jgi:Putative metal-binding motif